MARAVSPGRRLPRQLIDAPPVRAREVGAVPRHGLADLRGRSRCRPGALGGTSTLPTSRHPPSRLSAHRRIDQERAITHPPPAPTPHPTPTPPRPPTTPTTSPPPPPGHPPRHRHDLPFSAAVG